MQNITKNELALTDCQVKDVVFDLLETSGLHGFLHDEDSIFGSVLEAASWLQIQLSQEQVVLACSLVLKKQNDCVFQR